MKRLMLPLWSRIWLSFILSLDDGKINWVFNSLKSLADFPSTLWLNSQSKAKILRIIWKMFQKWISHSRVLKGPASLWNSMKLQNIRWNILFRFYLSFRVHNIICRLYIASRSVVKLWLPILNLKIYITPNLYYYYRKYSRILKYSKHLILGSHISISSLFFLSFFVLSIILWKKFQKVLHNMRKNYY